ncbi:transporter [Cesiribacter sp. SM1]|uniref:transporter n=1 Tax=Cesiribacter sp. SM1 TaxID=2861196 RepID=UPI001CD2768A|nr:transporter [Cesiribacter sp. SM1]
MQEAVWAQELVKETLPIITDRPDQTESAFLVPVRTLQLETEVKMNWENRSRSTLDYNSTLLRIGLARFAELRLTQQLQRQHIDVENGEIVRDGLGPLTVGTKILLWNEKALRPQAAVILDYVLPTGSEVLREGETSQYLVRGLFSHSLTDKVGLGYNIGGAYMGRNKFIVVYTLAVSRELTDKLGAYVEVFGEKENSDDVSLSADGGFTYLVLYNLQLDLSGGFGLTEEAENGYVSAGISWRFPY